MKVPERIKLANTPTPIYEFNEINPNRQHTNLYIKRDDFTGIEMSGNKVRKLEFSLKEALDLEAEVFITAGGIQSNHCRATAAAAAKLGKKAHLVLNGEDTELTPEGNLLLDMFFDAEITYLSAEEYATRKDEVMEEIMADYAAQNIVSYILPVGASNGIGTFGYYSAFMEILEQEEELGITFDTICITEGSGGTYAGVYLANEVMNTEKTILGFHISNVNADIKPSLVPVIDEACEIGDYDGEIDCDNMRFITNYAGEGYGIASEEVIEFIKDTAKVTGIVFDPVYTGKALYGITKEIEDENPLLKGNVLFIHTGGIFGMFPQKQKFF